MGLAGHQWNGGERVQSMWDTCKNFIVETRWRDIGSNGNGKERNLKGSNSEIQEKCNCWWEDKFNFGAMNLIQVGAFKFSNEP